MSFVRNVSSSCPECRNATQAQIWSTVDSDLHPELKTQILGGTLNQISCSHCGFTTQSVEAVLFRDHKRRLMFYVLPSTTSDKINAEKQIRASLANQDYGSSTVKASFYVLEDFEALKNILCVLDDAERDYGANLNYEDWKEITDAILSPVLPWPLDHTCTCGRKIRTVCFCTDEGVFVEVDKYEPDVPSDLSIQCPNCDRQLIGFQCEECKQVFEWQMGVVKRTDSRLDTIEPSATPDDFPATGTFDLSSLPADQLLWVYGLAFAAAATDGSVSKEEFIALFELMDLSSFSEDQKNIVRGYAINPPTAARCLDEIASGPDVLRYAVIVAVVEVLLADDVISEEENAFLTQICLKLHINNPQREAIIKFVSEVKRIRQNGVDSNDAELAMKTAASGLTAVGVPIAAVYFSGSVIGLSAAGITSGLAALGLGLGMVPGIGVAVLIGTGVFLGVRRLLGDSKKTKEHRIAAERERKAQLVIKNLQETINALLNRLEILQSQVNEIEIDREAIDVLRERLSTLNRILQQRKA